MKRVIKIVVITLFATSAFAQKDSRSLDGSFKFKKGESDTMVAEFIISSDSVFTLPDTIKLQLGASGAKIDSAKVDTDTLKFWVGSTEYNAFAVGAAPGSQSGAPAGASFITLNPEGGLSGETALRSLTHAAVATGDTIYYADPNDSGNLKKGVITLGGGGGSSDSSWVTTQIDTINEFNTDTLVIANDVQIDSTVTLTNLTASRLVATDANNGLVSTITGANLNSSISDANAVFESRTITISGTANEITSSAGAQDLSANRTWTLSLPTRVEVDSLFPADSVDLVLGASGAGQIELTDSTNITGLLNVSTLTASRIVATDASSNLVSTITEANLETSVSDDNPIFDGDFGSNGFMVRTAAGTYTNRSITAATAGLDISNGDGVSGNAAISLDVAPSSGSATLVEEEDAVQVLYGATLTESGNGLDVDTTLIATQDDISSFVPTSRTITISGTANEITSSAGAQDLSANRTWTLSLPTHVLLDSLSPDDSTDLVLQATAAGQIELVDTVNITGTLTVTGNIAGNNLSGTNTGDEALSTSSAGLDVSDHVVDLDVTPSSGSATLEQAEDALQVNYGETLTESGNGLDVDTSLVASQFDLLSYLLLADYNDSLQANLEQGTRIDSIKGDASKLIYSPVNDLLTVDNLRADVLATLDSARIDTTPIFTKGVSANQILKWNATNRRFEPAADATAGSGSAFADSAATDHGNKDFDELFATSFLGFSIDSVKVATSNANFIVVARGEGDILLQDSTTVTGLLAATIAQAGFVNVDTVRAADSTVVVVNEDLKIDSTLVVTGNLNPAGGVTDGSLAVADLGDVNAGTDLTADLEEETHASEHQNSGADEIDLNGMQGTIILLDTLRAADSTIIVINEDVKIDSTLNMSDMNITNVGSIDADSLNADGSTIVIGDGTPTVTIQTSDWDISTTGAMTGFAFDANGTGNSLTNVESADIADGTITVDDIGADAVGESELIESMNFTGTGTWIFDSLRVDTTAIFTQGVTNGQVLKWDGTQRRWEPAADNTASVAGSVFVSVTTYDSDTDTLHIQPSGFAATNIAAAGTRAIQLKDGTTELFYADTSGNVQVTGNLTTGGAAFITADGASIQFGASNDANFGWNETDDIIAFNTADGNAGNDDYATWTFAYDTDNNEADADQEIFEVGRDGTDDSDGDFTELFSVDQEGDVFIAGNIEAIQRTTIPIAVYFHPDDTTETNASNVSLGTLSPFRGTKFIWLPSSSVVGDTVITELDIPDSLLVNNHWVYVDSLVAYEWVGIDSVAGVDSVDMEFYWHAYADGDSIQADLSLPNNDTVLVTTDDQFHGLIRQKVNYTASGLSGGKYVQIMVIRDVNDANDTSDGGFGLRILNLIFEARRKSTI